ncbi:hypothetical protein I553_2835 [Mycobacterium xenopi 4042]|uniref:Uncharacterized protein n=1 Tax=Mycobacterium xenopi 4042 TaxID=1299334 RepID=X8EEB8_MYCXE|nr:hypothetical protein I552_3408 [Mycobacterium xenopi 3993]EUA78546.1 hypothetical protein I553_2835 [Mycobacterium xenopi 4042]
MTTAIVVTLTLVALGIVIDRLMWLRRWLNKPPLTAPMTTGGREPRHWILRRYNPVNCGNPLAARGADRAPL